MVLSDIRLLAQELSSIDKGHSKVIAGKAQRRRDDMQLGEALASLAISAAFAFGERLVGRSRWVHMFEMVQLLAGTNLFLLAFSVLIFDIPRYTLSLVSLGLVRRAQTKR